MTPCVKCGSPAFVNYNGKEWLCVSDFIQACKRDGKDPTDFVFRIPKR
jgi:hypothetical protein